MTTAYNLITILGPTATGKTTVATHLAAKLNSCVISADSRQVYKGMSLGTGKDLNEYLVDGKQIPYYLIDIVNAGEKYNLFEFQNDFVDVYTPFLNKGVIPVFCGGSGLYIESVLKAYKLVSVPINQPLRLVLENKTLEELLNKLASLRTLHNTTDSISRKRLVRAIEIEIYQDNNKLSTLNYPKLNSLIVGINFERAIQKQRITDRLHSRLNEGLINEVQMLLNSGISPDDLVYYGLEYKFITLHLIGQLSYAEMVEKLNIAIHQFSKRQMTWFRKMERDGFNINWIDGFLPLDEKLTIISELLKKL